MTILSGIVGNLSANRDSEKVCRIDILECVAATIQNGKSIEQYTFN
jgi:hypothetical protein